MDANIVSSAIFSNDASCIKEEFCANDLYKLIFIKKGISTLRVGEKEYICSSPCLIFLGISEPYAFNIQSNIYERYIISLNPDAEDNDIPSLRQLFFTHREGYKYLLPIEDDHELICGLIKETTEEAARDGGKPDIWARALISKILHIDPNLVFYPYTQKERIVASTREKIEKEPSKAFDLDDLATDSYISRFYLSHIFSDVTGYSIKNYILSCRLALSCRLLCSDKIPIGKISALSGFPDMSNFSRYFKEAIGMTPTQYRRLALSAKKS